MSSPSFGRAGSASTSAADEPGRGFGFDDRRTRTRAHSHLHEADHALNGHGHSHGLVDPSIVRSRAGIRAVSLSLAVLAAAALAQTAVFLITDSVALLADLIHNFGDALTALPL